MRRGLATLDIRLLPPLPPARTLKKTLGNKNTTDLLCSLADLSGMLQHRRRIRAVVRSAAPRGKAAVGGWGFDGGAAALLAEPAAVLAGAEPASSFSPPPVPANGGGMAVPQPTP